ncbi:hypothetical protein GA0061098_1009122 [Bradyrhizobium shewense]|uniref:Uncharacterized protein n=1 Tax=Bradyrhizobium shewense TaxID=1761772 RepID=A0A1C3WQY0_9BRAD|nr:hypothetical protein GA0061098_1009122 [Bradyrhizobium shewense]
MCFSAAASSVKAQGSMNLASNTAPVGATMPSRVAATQEWTGCRTRFWMSVLEQARAAFARLRDTTLADLTRAKGIDDSFP